MNSKRSGCLIMGFRDSPPLMAFLIHTLLAEHEDDVQATIRTDVRYYMPAPRGS